MKKNDYKKRFINVDRIAKIKTTDMPIKHSATEPPVHYVYVRSYDKKTQTYSVNVCTHLDSYNKKNKRFEYNFSQLDQVKKGNTYPIPRYSSTFPSWTGIKKDVLKIPKGTMYGWNCFKIKKNHNKTKFDNYFK